MLAPTKKDQEPEIRQAQVSVSGSRSGVTGWRGSLNIWPATTTSPAACAPPELAKLTRRSYTTPGDATEGRRGRQRAVHVRPPEEGRRSGVHGGASDGEAPRRPVPVIKIYFWIVFSGTGRNPVWNIWILKGFRRRASRCLLILVGGERRQAVSGTIESDAYR